MPANVWVLRLFGPVLILTGVLGFLLPPQLALMSGAPAYNVFHIVFGLAGTAIAFKGSDGGCRAFNAAFGAVDLYQFVASLLAWFPLAYFRWTRIDDALHLMLGVALVAIGCWPARGRDLARAE